MKKILSFLCLIVLQILCAKGTEPLYGLARMEHLEDLPRLTEGVRVMQASSYDRSGGNDDGFNGTYSSLYIDEHGEYVLFDEIGAGCIYRFWMTYNYTLSGYSTNQLHFYFDDESAPKLNITIDDLFDGTGAPFLFPLVGKWNQSSSGFYCYVPFPFKNRLKITMTGKPLFYNITYHRFDSGTGITSWTGAEDFMHVLSQ